jgi:hypothetical protein
MTTTRTERRCGQLLEHEPHRWGIEDNETEAWCDGHPKVYDSPAVNVAFVSLLASLEEFATECEEDFAAGLEDSTTPDTLAILLSAARACRANLSTFEKILEAELISRAGQKRFVVEGLGEVEVRKSTKRTQWRHDELLPVLIARIMDEPETIFAPDTGELLPYTQIGANLTGRLRECVGFGAGKVTGLRPLGIDPSEFCTETADGYSVQLPRRSE